MNIGFCYENDVNVEFTFSPLSEMLASMHVLSKPEHHLDRVKWVRTTTEEMPCKLLEDIRKYGYITNEWLIVMDFSVISPYSELCIPDALKELEKLSLYKWNKVYKPYDKSISVEEKSNIIDIMKRYYEIVFSHEINFLQPFLIHTIKREIKTYREEGLLNRIDKIHERIEIKETEIILHKNKEYRFDAKKLSKISITASTFISPHLLMYEDKGILYLTILVLMEEKEETVPADLVNLLKALGDETRLKILHEMRKEPAATQSLAVNLKLTEAGISKHLKVLSNAGLVNKVRQGNYMMYSINKDAIDYIPYKLYEYIMR